VKRRAWRNPSFVGFDKERDHGRQSVSEEIVDCAQGYAVRVGEVALLVWLTFPWIQELLISVLQFGEELPEFLVELLGKWAA
jgi:hypothetical protein